MRSVKVFIAAALAAAALGALPAAASAGTGVFVGGEPATLQADGYPASITGSIYNLNELNGKAVVFETEGASISCSKAQYTPWVSLPSPKTAFAWTTEYSGCVAPQFGGATAKVSSCAYTLKNFAKVEGDIYTHEARLACNMKITFVGCTIELPSQVLGGGESLAVNVEDGSEKVLGSMTIAHGLSYTASGLCPLGGIKNGTYESGSAEHDILFRGTF